MDIVPPRRSRLRHVPSSAQPVSFPVASESSVPLPSVPSVPVAAREVPAVVPPLVPTPHIPQQPRSRRSAREVGRRALTRFQQGAFSPLGLSVGALVLLLTVVATSQFARRADVTEAAVKADGAVALTYVAEAAGSLQQQDFEGASYKFNAAAERFLTARKAVDELGSGLDDVIAWLPVRTSVTSRIKLLEAGSDLAIAGKYLSRAMEPFRSAPDTLQPLKTGVEQDPKEGIALTEAVAIASQNLRFSELKLVQARAALDRVRPDDLPEEMRGQVRLLQESLPPAEQLVHALVSQADFLLSFLGQDQQKSYLVLFQNDHELRPTGGFIGTIGILTLDQGRIKGIKMEEPYHLDGQLSRVVAAPEPMRMVQARAYMRDMNYFLDFPTSAERVSAYLDLSGGQTVDGVIALNASIMEDLLAFTGPVTVPGYDFTVDAETFYENTQQQVEHDYDKERNRPKQYVVDLLPAVLQNAFSERTDWIALTQLLASSLEQKDLLLWFADKDLEARVQELGYGGEIRATDRDYLSVVSTNAGGGKTDSVIRTRVRHEAELQSDGSVIDTVTIDREHAGDPEDLWVGTRNISFLRAYVPLGSELLEADGFDPELWGNLFAVPDGAEKDPVVAGIEDGMQTHEPTKTRITQETGQTVFGNWTALEPGQRKAIRLRYRLPFRLDPNSEGATARYSAFFQRQPGARNVSLISRFAYPTKLSATWQYASDGDLAGVGHTRTFEADWDRDRSYTVLLR